ncbi:MAG: carboxypeptidase regulatory-like domain-containing protein [Verrucomicrobiota bacterium]|nr:carboxypeptidase regulatory-like domain-containing protein [Limisphaera sp.]MDW8381674.1 carboxypeptidase regulatory-like domain-containing protein [Verrucomicrobiota bacterium]
MRTKYWATQWAVAVALVWGPHLPALAGEIRGKIILKGNVPANPVVKDLSADPNCSKLVKGAVQVPMFRVGPNGELADVFVSLAGITGKSTGATAPPAVLDQRGCMYVPYVLAIQTKQTLLVKNSDPLLHNVHATPTAPGNKTRNEAQLAGGPDLKFSFDAPEKFLRFKCDVHPWMFAYVCVSDHPWFALSGEDGSFVIKDVPPGKYTLEASHRKLGDLKREIEVADGVVNVDFVFEAK